MSTTLFTTYSTFNRGPDDDDRSHVGAEGGFPMSTEPLSQGGQPTPSVACRVCGTVVPLGAFCGFCGAHLAQQRGNGPDWLRVRAFAAAPGEHLLQVSAVSSLFPHLPHRSRAAFRVGLAALVVVLVIVALLRWQAPLIALSALGFPLLFQIYLQESDVYDDLPVRALLLTAVTGAGLGVGWALLTGPIVARSYTVGAGLGVTGQQMLRDGLAIPLGGAVLMLVPAALVRALRPPTRESLDGYLIGSLGAIAYTAAAILTRLTPQLATGPVARDRPVGGLLVEAGIQGIAMPVTAAAAGGLVGATLWYTRREDPLRRGLSWAALVPAVAVVLAVYAGLGLLDTARLPQGLQLALHLVIAALAILALRIALHTTLLHEAHELMGGEPLLCVHCHHVVPDMAFCASCGVAIRASSRFSRAARRRSRPVPTDPPDTTVKTAPTTTPSAPVWAGYAVPSPSYTAAPVRHTSHTRLFVMLGAALAVGMVAGAFVSWLFTPPPPSPPHCPPFCRPPARHPGGPPPPVSAPPRTGLPAPSPGPSVQTYPRFTPKGGGFSVAYPEAGAFEGAFPLGGQPAPSGKGVVLASGDGESAAVLFGEPAGKRTPRQIAQALIQQNYPGATTAYEIPNAMVGYQPGYGEIDDYYIQNSNSNSAHLRVLAMVAVKDGLALIAYAHGPYDDFAEEPIVHHPSGADLLIADAIVYFVNSFSWRGNPPG
jgi:hypothetical protein